MDGMMCGYRMKVKNHIIDVSILGPFKDIPVDFLIFGPTTGRKSIFPFGRRMQTDEYIAEFNKRAECEDMDPCRTNIGVPLENGDAWIIFNSDVLLRDEGDEKLDESLICPDCEDVKAPWKDFCPSCEIKHRMDD